MGIQGLWSLLNSKHANVMEIVSNIEDYHGETWGIDVSIYMHRLFGTSDDGCPIDAFIEQAQILLEAGIKPIYIFDGDRGELKVYEHKRRAVQKTRQQDVAQQRVEFLKHVQEHEGEITQETIESIGTKTKLPPDVNKALKNRVMNIAGGTINIEANIEQMVVDVESQTERDATAYKVQRIPHSYYEQLLQAFIDNGIECFTAKSDAEKLGAYLTLNGKIDAFVTDDGDAIAFGAKRIVRNLLKYGKHGMMMISSESVYSNLGLTREQFVDVCIMSGCDYTESRGLPSIGMNTAINIIKKHGDIPSYLQSKDWEKKLLSILKRDETFTLEQFQWQNAREMFLSEENQIYEHHGAIKKAKQMPIIVTGNASGCEEEWLRVACDLHYQVHVILTKNKRLSPTKFISTCHLTDEAKVKSLEDIQNASIHLGSEIRDMDVLQRNWKIAKSTNVLLAIGSQGEKGIKVSGGTGWTCQMFYDRGIKTIYLYDVDKECWNEFDGVEWGPIKKEIRIDNVEKIGCVGTRTMTETIRKVIFQTLNSLTIS